MTNLYASQWNHDFPRLARDAGFMFDVKRGKVVTNWNDIKVIDIDQIIRDRDFTTIDNCLTQVLDCQLDKEFDVRILDSGFVKLFRLSQLSVEYLIQCRKFLDSSVYSLRRQAKEMTEEIEYLKKLLKNKEEEIRKLRNRTKKHQKTTDYIKSSDLTDIFRRMVMNEGYHGRNVMDEQLLEAFHKCEHCDKVFLNQFYLHSHLSRRHPNKNVERTELLSPGVSPIHNNLKYKAETERLLKEIKELKDRVNATEERLNSNDAVVDNDLVKVCRKDDVRDVEIKEDKVEQDCMEKETVAKAIFESWKRDEQVKFDEQIATLKRQLDEVMKESMRQKEVVVKETGDSESKEMTRLNEALKQQEMEIQGLKAQLQQKVNEGTTDMKKQLDDQEKMWQNKLKMAEDEHKKRLEEITRNMSSMMGDAKTLQQQYMTKIEALEVEATKQKKLLEEQTRKLAIVEKDSQAAKEVVHSSKPDSVRSPDRSLVRRGNNFEEVKRIGVAESTETLPPYDEAPVIDISKTNLQKNHPSTSSRTDSSKESSKVKESTDNVKTLYVKHQSESSEDDAQWKGAKRQLFPVSGRNKSGEERSNRDDGRVKQTSPVKNVEKKKRSREVSDDSSSSEDSHQFAPDTGRSKSTSSSKSFQRNNSGRESQRDRIMNAVKGDLVQILNKRLQQMGISKSHKGLSKEMYDKNITVVKHREQVFAKKYTNYNKLKKKITNVLDERAKDLVTERNPRVNLETRKSNLSLNKMGTLLSNVKSKALSKIKDMKRTANESILSKTKNINTKQGNPQSARSPVKNSSAQNNTKITTASIMNLAKNLESPTQIAESSDLETKSESESELSRDLGNNERPKTIVTTAISHLPSTSVENLLNSPIRKPQSYRDDTNASITSSTPTKRVENKASYFGDLSDVDDRKPVANVVTKSEENITSSMYGGASSSSEYSSYEINNADIRKAVSEDNVSSARGPSQKGVLKSAVSTSALAKKKVLFDLEANQIKSRSTSPSVSAAVEVKGKESWENRADEGTDDSDSDWNISNPDINSSLYKIPSEDIKLSTKQSPKIAEISKTIGQQLGARTSKPPVGSVDTLFKQQAIDMGSPKNPNPYNGSTTSIGSSVFEGNNLASSTSKSSVPQPPVPKPRIMQVKDKMDSDLELSDWSIEDLLVK